MARNDFLIKWVSYHINVCPRDVYSFYLRTLTPNCSHLIKEITTCTCIALHCIVLEISRNKCENHFVCKNYWAET